MSCAQQAQLAAIVSAVFITLNVVSLVSFYGWRRARGLWRSILFAVFVFCALVVLDFFVYAIVPEPPPAKPLPKCP